MYPKDNAFMYPNDNLLFTSEEIKKYEELFKKCKQNDNRCLTSALGMHSLNHERYMTYGIFRKTETKGGQREILDSTAQENIRNQLNLLVRKDDLSSSETCTA